VQDTEERQKKNPKTNNQIQTKQTNKEHTIQEIQKMNNMNHIIKQEVKPDAPKV
jgi:hypothetical protein